MLDVIASLSLVGAMTLLIALSYVDLRVRLLPNEMVLGFLTCGVVFHLTTVFRFIDPVQALAGAIAGFASLYLLRAAANRLYNQDALGLGDVKLMGAGGLWLGVEGVFLAMALGAFAGVIHGITGAVIVSRKYKTPLQLKGLQIPAGPGFAFGITAVALWQFRGFFGY
jgi:leader peptidase (prepilin peptidase)/N-methyltransferase